VLLEHNWGFGLTRRQWLRNKPFVDDYLKLIRRVDYHARDGLAISRLFASWGLGCPGDSQDCAKSLACCATGAAKINIRACLGKYIGATGIHMEQRWYDEIGYAKVECFDEPLPHFPALSPERYGDIIKVQQQWATEMPFHDGTCVEGMDFWNFSLQQFRRPGVVAALTALQDGLGLDSNLLLFCCWHGQANRKMDEAAVGRAISAIDAWQREVIQPMRAMRTRLRRKVGQIPSPESWAFHQKMRTIEIEAQRVAQATLQTLPAPSTGPGSAVDSNLALYLSAKGCDAERNPEFTPELERLSAGCRAQ
jgi:uncharacterized protein (TIGR02444 family)